MKKILALTLAAVMTAGMTTVAFATISDGEPAKGPANVTTNSTEHSSYEKSDAWDQVIVPAIGMRAYVINDEGEVDTTADKIEKFDVLDGGDEIAIPVFLYEYWEAKDANGNDLLERDSDGTGADHWGIPYEFRNALDYDENLDVWTDWDRNKADVDTRFVRVDGERTMCVIVTVPENDSDSIEDLIGNIKVGTSDSRARHSDFSYELDTSYAPDGTKEYYKDNFDGDEVLEAGETGIVDFDTEAGEIDIEFGDEALFTVNVTGQSRLNLAWNTRHDTEVAAMDESVNMDFITFTGNPSFNRTGTMYIYAADDTFLYQVVDGKLEKVDAKYNEDYEAWEFRTRTLGQYVIADGEIDLESITDNTDDSSSTTEDGNKANPDTGR